MAVYAVVAHFESLSCYGNLFHRRRIGRGDEPSVSGASCYDHHIMNNPFGIAFSVDEFSASFPEDEAPPTGWTPPEEIYHVTDAFLMSNSAEIKSQRDRVQLVKFDA